MGGTWRAIATAGTCTLLLIAGCRVGGISTPAAAAVFAATAVGATAAKRSYDGGCWANCSAGWHCEPKRGVCVQNEKRDLTLPAATASALSASPSAPVTSSSTNSPAASSATQSASMQPAPAQSARPASSTAEALCRPPLRCDEQGDGAH